MAERNTPKIHSCGVTMERLLSIPALVLFPLTGRDVVLKTLNKEDRYTFPGQNKHRPRYEQAMAKGLNPERPVVGKGFGG